MTHSMNFQNASPRLDFATYVAHKHTRKLMTYQCIATYRTVKADSQTPFAYPTQTHTHSPQLPPIYTF